MNGEIGWHWILKTRRLDGDDKPITEKMLFTGSMWFDKDCDDPVDLQ